MNIPAGTARTFSNEAFATAIYAGRTFSAVGGADVVRTNISLTKLATDDGAPEPGDVVTYTLLVRNNGGSAETTVRITDAIPPGTTFVTGSITTGAPFAGAYSAQQNAVVWSAASFASGASATLTFQVRINPDTDVGTVIPNRGIYESTQTPTFFSNETQTTVVGPAAGRDQDHRRRHPLRPPPPRARAPSRSRCATREPAAATNLRISDAPRSRERDLRRRHDAVERQRGAPSSPSPTPPTRTGGRCRAPRSSSSSRASPRARTCASASRHGSTRARAAWS